MMHARGKFRLAPLAAMLMAFGCVAAEQNELIEIGRAIYHEGRLPSGDHLQATVRRDTPLSGDQLSCVSCHRKSGIGSSEGRYIVPPVSAHYLYRPHEIRHRKMQDGRTVRPAYDEASLARAIRQGVDPSGRTMLSLMPRYAMGELAMRGLVAYLKTLSRDFSPGVGDETIHIATVTSDGVEPSARRSMLDVLDAFIKRKNAGTRNETYRRAHAPFQREWHNHAYRKWQLHEWRLRGDPSDWPEQLAAHYRQQPVFAMVSGLVDGPWRPVQAFCDGNRLPCLFPNTDLPPADADSGYVLHFSAGPHLEAGVIADDLAMQPDIARVMQIHGDDAFARQAAASLSGRLEARLPIETQQADRTPTVGPLKDAALVLWLTAEEMATMDVSDMSDARRIYLSSTLHGGAPTLVAPLPEQHSFAVHPFELPSRMQRRTLRTRHWLKSMGLDDGDPRIRSNSFFAVSAFGEGITHVKNLFYREYLMERLEHMLDRMLVSSVYPRVSLGPQQRYASKGAYLIRLADMGDAEKEQKSRWIVPSVGGLASTRDPQRTTKEQRREGRLAATSLTSVTQEESHP